MTQFQLLFKVRINHGYYAQECRDMGFFPANDKVVNLNNGKILLRERDGSLYALYEALSPNTPWRSIAGQRIQIGMLLHNPNFANFTELDSNTLGTVLYYRNGASQTQLDSAVRYQLQGGVLSHVLKTAVRPVTVSLKDGSNQTVQSELISASNDRSTVNYDLSRNTGIYSVEEVSADPTQLTSYYCHPEFHRRGVFGIVDIAVHSGFYSSAPEFLVPFAARNETLKYYVIAKNYSDSDVNQLSVIDTGFTQGGWPQVQFSKLLSNAFTGSDISPALLLNGIANSKLLMFKSTLPVSRRELARNKIQLKKNNDVLIGNLPQTRPERSDANIIIQISKP